MDREISGERLAELRRMPYKKYLDTPEWLAFSTALKDFVGKCQLCGDKDRGQHVHHNSYERIGCEDITDVVVLCNRCHFLYELRISGVIKNKRDLHKERMPYDAQDLCSLKMLRSCTFDNFDLREHELDQEGAENLRKAFVLAQAFAKNPQDWIVFSGSYGCGKTHLAAAVANARCDALFVRYSDLARYLQNGFGEGESVWVDRAFCDLRKSPFLVVDNLLFFGNKADFWFFDLLEYRYFARLPTVLTSAKDVDFPVRVKSLVLDVGRCTPFMIMAPSYRGFPTRNITKTRRNRNTRR